MKEILEIDPVISFQNFFAVLVTSPHWIYFFL